MFYIKNILCNTQTFVWNKIKDKQKVHLSCRAVQFQRASLTHWGRVMYICVGNLTIIWPDNGLSLGRRQAIIWTNAGILFPEEQTSLNRYSCIFIQENSFENVVCEMASILSRPQCVNLPSYQGKHMLIAMPYIATEISNGYFFAILFFAVLAGASKIHCGDNYIQCAV